MALLEVDPLKLSDPDAASTAYRAQTAELNKLAANRLLGADKYRASDAVQRLANIGKLDTQRLANVGSFANQALAKNIVLPGMTPAIASELGRRAALDRGQVAASTMLDRQKGGFGADPSFYGRSVEDLARAPTKQTPAISVLAAQAGKPGKDTISIRETVPAGRIPGTTVPAVRTTTQARPAGTPTGKQPGFFNATQEDIPAEAIGAYTKALEQGLVKPGDRVEYLGMTSRGPKVLIHSSGQSPRKQIISPKRSR
jgi:hypothetical protein